MTNYRDYQLQAINAGFFHIRKSIEPGLVVVGTGGGKSHIIAGIAEKYLKWCGFKRKILVTAPKAEIVLANHSKYTKNGYKANIYCGKLNLKQIKHDVTFASPQSVLNNIQDFENYGLIIVDEPANMPPTLRAIIDYFKQHNPNFRVLATYATPYAIGTGYIYELDENNKRIEETNNPYFKKKVCDFSLKYLIENGWNLPPVFKTTANDTHYNTEIFNGKSVSNAKAATAFEGKRETAAKFVYDFLAKTQDRHSCLIFAQTIQHAKEILEFLPENSELITGKTKNREAVFKRFENFEIKYLVNVDLLTVGIDVPCIDAIGIARYTESIALYEQIIGRGTRRYVENDGITPKEYPDGTVKHDFLVLDYTDNLSRHFPSGDFFKPNIKAKKNKGSKAKIEAKCETCGQINTFSQRDNPQHYPIDDAGYFAVPDQHGNIKRIDIELSDGRIVGMPAHFGRRCEYEQPDKTGKFQRCNGRWAYKLCKNCGCENDIAAKYCEKCNAEIINPNEKIKKEAATLTKNIYEREIAYIDSVEFRKHEASSGRRCLLAIAKIKDENRKLQFYIYGKHQLSSVISKDDYKDFYDDSLWNYLQSVRLNSVEYNRNKGHLNLIAFRK